MTTIDTPMVAHCSECGRQLVPWRALDSVAFDAGWVKQARLEVCPPCRRTYRVTVTVWRTGLAENQPTHTEWAVLDRWARSTTQ